MAGGTELRARGPTLRLPLLLALAVALAGLVVAAALAGRLLLAATQPAASAGASLDGSPLVGHPLPSTTLTRLDGGKLDLATLRGRPVLLNFWATWCVPCRKEVPELEAFAGREAGWSVIGVDELEGPGQVAAFASDLAVTYPLAVDRDGQVGQRLLLNGLPTTIVIDARGVVRQVHLGALSSADLDRYARTFGPG